MSLADDSQQAVPTLSRPMTAEDHDGGECLPSVTSIVEVVQMSAASPRDQVHLYLEIVQHTSVISEGIRHPRSLQYELTAD